MFADGLVPADSLALPAVKGEYLEPEALPPTALLVVFAVHLGAVTPNGDEQTGGRAACDLIPPLEPSQAR